MKAPLRLLDDPTVDSSLQADLAYAAEHGSGSFDLEAGLLRLRDGLSGELGATNEGELLPEPVATSKGGFASLAISKGAIVGGASAALMALLFFGLSGSKGSKGELEPREESQKEFTEVRAQLPVSPGTPSIQSNGEESGEVTEVAKEGEGVSQVASPRAAHLSHSPSKGSSSLKKRKSSPTVDTPEPLIKREIAHLIGLRSALASTPATALQMAQRGHLEFSEGFLHEEREGLAIMALQRLGRRKEAEVRVRRFASRYPHSPLLPKLGHPKENEAHSK